MERIRALRVPNSNVQVIQQTTMLRYRALFDFMLQHHPQLANEIKQAYMHTMRWYYSHHFDRFKKALEKVRIVNRVDMLGSDDSKKGGLFSTKGVTGGLPANDPFHLGDRIDILKEGNDLVSMQARDLEKPVNPIYRKANHSTSPKFYSEITLRRSLTTLPANTFS